jgi:hypothetical protein
MHARGLSGVKAEGWMPFDCGLGNRNQAASVGAIDRGGHLGERSAGRPGPQRVASTIRSDFFNASIAFGLLRAGRLAHRSLNDSLIPSRSHVCLD